MMAVDPEAQRRREECERKARRGEMDPRLEFVFQLLMDGTQLPRHQIMDHIFDGDMVIPCFDFIAIMLEFCKKKRVFCSSYSNKEEEQFDQIFDFMAFSVG